MKTLPKVYSQKDPLWASQRLGTVDGTTIGQEGCYDTCFTMVADYFGHNITPADFDNACTDKYYIDGNEATDDMLNKVFPDCEYVQSYNFYTSPADLGLLKTLLDDPSQIVIVEVDFDHDPTDGIQTHFMVAVDVVQNPDGTFTIKVADPWQLPGSVDDFSKNYGTNPSQTILKYVVYKGKPVSELNTYGLDPSNIQSEQVVYDTWYAVTQGQYVEALKLTTATQTIDDLTQKLEAIEVLNSDLKKQLADASQPVIKVAVTTPQVPETSQNLTTSIEQAKQATKFSLLDWFKKLIGL